MTYTYTINESDHFNIKDISFKNDNYLLIPIPINELHYKINFVDNDSSKVTKFSESDKVEWHVFQLKRKHKDAPKLIAATNGKKDYRSGDSIWTLLPIASKHLKAIKWSAFDGHQSPMDIVKGIPIIEKKNINELVGSSAKANNKTSIITILYSDGKNELRYAYEMDLASWRNQAAIKSFKEDQATTCSSNGSLRDARRAPSEFRRFIRDYQIDWYYLDCWHNYREVNYPEIVSKVYWGTSPDNLRLMTPPNFPHLIASHWSSIDQKILHLKEKLGVLQKNSTVNADEIVNLKSIIVNLEEKRLNKEIYSNEQIKVISEGITKQISKTFAGWHENKRARFAAYSLIVEELPTELFFQYLLQDGTLTNIHRVPIKTYGY